MKKTVAVLFATIFLATATFGSASASPVVSETATFGSAMASPVVSETATFGSATASPLASVTPQSSSTSKTSNVFGGVIQMDKTVHDFGDILISDGAVSATFTAKNISQKATAIYNVVSSCGCTNVEWTKKPLKPGESGTIKVTYKNDEGAFPFDKTITAYFAGLKQPIVLRLRGESHAKKLSLNELYSTRFGDLGFKSVDIKCGNLSQGQQKSGEVVVANLGQKPLDVSFSDVSDGLSVKLSPNPIPAQSTAKLSFIVTSDRNHWGKNYYYATPVVGGAVRKAVVSQTPAKENAPGSEALLADANPLTGAGKSKIGIFAITKEDFSSWTKAQRDNGANPIAESSTYSFGKIAAGTVINGSFTITNQGKSPLRIYKVDSESNHLTLKNFPDLPSGKKGNLDFAFDTKGLPKGESLIVLTLTTNSPLRPIMNLFVSGWIE